MVLLALRTPCAPNTAIWYARGMRRDLPHAAVWSEAASPSVCVSCACAMCPIRPVPGSPTCPASSRMRSSGPPTAEPHRESRRPTAQEYDITPRAENRTCLGLARRLPRLCAAGARDVGALRRRQRACGLRSPVTEVLCGTQIIVLAKVGLSREQKLWAGAGAPGGTVRRAAVRGPTAPQNPPLWDFAQKLDSE